MRIRSADEAADMEARIAALEALVRGHNISNVTNDAAQPDAAAEAWVAAAPEAPAAEMWLQSHGALCHQDTSNIRRVSFAKLGRGKEVCCALCDHQTTRSVVAVS